LDKLQIALAYEATSDQTVMTIQGILPEDVSLPTKTALIVPEYFTFQKASPLVGAHNLDVSEIDHEIEIVETGNRYLFEISEGNGILTLFTFAGSPFLTLDNDSLVVGLEITAPSDLSEIEFAFVAPEGRIGTGEGVELLGTDTVGNEAYGVVLANIKEGELATAVVEFPTSEQSMLDAAITSLTNWVSNLFNLVVTIAAIVLIGLLLGLLAMLRRQRRSNEEKRAIETTDADSLIIDDEIAQNVSAPDVEAHVSVNEDFSYDTSEDRVGKTEPDYTFD